MPDTFGTHAWRARGLTISASILLGQALQVDAPYELKISTRPPIFFTEVQQTAIGQTAVWLT